MGQSGRPRICQPTLVWPAARDLNLLNYYYYLYLYARPDYLSPTPLLFRAKKERKPDLEPVLVGSRSADKFREAFSRICTFGG